MLVSLAYPGQVLWINNDKIIHGKGEMGQHHDPEHSHVTGIVV